MQALGEAIAKAGFPLQGEKIIEAARNEHGLKLADIVRSQLMTRFDEQLENGTEPTPEELREVLESCKKLPYQMRATFGDAIKRMPHAPGGAPPKLTDAEKEDVCTRVGSYMGQGHSFREALQRVAKEKSVSTRTVQRAWQERQRIKNIPL